MKSIAVPSELTLLSAKDIAKSSGMGLNTVYGLMRSASFPSIKIGGRYYVTTSAYAQWLTENQKCKWAV